MGLGASTSPIAPLSVLAATVACRQYMSYLLLILNRREASYFLLSRLANVLVRFEESADVHGLSAPDVSVDGPVEGELEGAAV